MMRCTPPVLMVVIGFCVAGIGCGKDGSPTGPTPVPTVQPTRTRVTVFGVISKTSGGPAASVSVRATGPGPTVTTTTDGNGYYSLPGVTIGSVTLALGGTGYVARSESVAVSADTQHDMRIEAIPLYSRSGTGNDVFDMPRRQMRVRITGDYAGGSSNFIVHIGPDHVVNEIIGTSWPSTHYSGVHLVQGGLVEIVHSDGVRWSIQEMR